MKKKILFLSSLVPDIEEFQNNAFTRSGNNVLQGIARGLVHLGQDVECYSCRPIPSYPRHKSRWLPGCVYNTKDGIKVRLLPTLNFRVIKNLFWGIYLFFFLFGWKWKNRKRKCDILVYNIYCPPLPFLFFASKLLNIHLNVIFYDLGIPPNSLNLSRFTMLAYKWSEGLVSYMMKRIDGRIIINESIIKHYAPESDYLLIDGGINEQITSHLFPLEISRRKEYIFVCAGMLWEQNGTKLILEAMNINKSPNIRVVFAGRGNDVPLIEKASRVDSRIEYKGMLSLDHLFALYQKADILLNLRIEEENDFHFPSKLLEYLSTGKHVLSTSIAHAERDYGSFLSILNQATPQALAKKMEEIEHLSKEDLFKTGHKARDFMLANRMWNERTKEITNYMYNHQK